MNNQPFSIFAPFQDRIAVTFFSKSDAVSSDADLKTLLHTAELATVQQVHGKKTIIVREAVERAPDADGLITDTKNLTLAVRVADCQSFVVYEPKSNVVGVLHAGWKGLISKAIPEFFRTLESEWNILATDTYVGAGPSLCQKCAEFTDPLQELPDMNPRFFSGRCADLRGYADQQLMDMGVDRGRIERMDDCTKCKKFKYYSYRGGDKEAVMQGWDNVLVCTLK